MTSFENEFKQLRQGYLVVNKRYSDENGGRSIRIHAEGKTISSSWQKNNSMKVKSSSPSFLKAKGTADVGGQVCADKDEIESKFVNLEKELDLLYERVPFGCHTLDHDGTYRSINSQELSWLGCTREEVVGRKKFTDFLTPASQETLGRHLASSLKNRYVDNLEIELIGKDGAIRHTALSSVDDRDVDGNILTSRFVLYDISGRKQAEAELRIAAIVFESQEGIMVTDAGGIILQVNQAFTKLTGYSKEEAVGHTPSFLHSGIQDHTFYRRLWKTLKQGHFWQGEIWNKRKDSNIISEWLTITAILSPDGIITNYVGTFSDITEHKRMEEVLRKSSNQLRIFIQQAPISIAMFDRDMNCLATSGRWLEEHGHGCASLTGKDPFVRQLDVPDKWKQAHQQGLEGITLENNEDRWIDDDGSIHWQRWTLLPWIDENAKIGGTIITTVDITESKNLEMEIMERRKEMAELHTVHVATQTAAAIAHDLNQPLLAIATYSEAALMLLKSDKPDLDKIQKAVSGCERQALRAGKSIRELLDFLGMREMPVEAFDLNKEIHEVLNTAKMEYELQFETILQLEKELPLVRASRTHVNKALLNLVRNGIEAMQEAGIALPSITVTAGTNRDENIAQVTVHDNGPGVTDEVMHRLFKPFFSTKEKGMGMGLAVSRSLIEENGGKLWLDPLKAPGATFHLTLPFAS